MTVHKSCHGISLSLDSQNGAISSLVIGGKERLAGKQPLFRIGLRDLQGNLRTLSAFDTCNCEPTVDGARYFDFPKAKGLSVRIHLDAHAEELAWYLEPENKKAGLRSLSILLFITFDYSASFAFCIRLVIIFITRTVATVSTIPIGRQIHAFCTKPATMNMTNEIAAIVTA